MILLFVLNIKNKNQVLAHATFTIASSNLSKFFRSAGFIIISRSLL